MGVLDSFLAAAEQGKGNYNIQAGTYVVTIMGDAGVYDKETKQIINPSTLAQNDKGDYQFRLKFRIDSEGPENGKTPSEFLSITGNQAFKIHVLLRTLYEEKYQEITDTLKKINETSKTPIEDAYNYILELLTGTQLYVTYIVNMYNNTTTIREPQTGTMIAVPVDPKKTKFCWTTKDGYIPSLTYPGEEE